MWQKGRQSKRMRLAILPMVAVVPHHAIYPMRGGGAATSGVLREAWRAFHDPGVVILQALDAAGDVLHRRAS